MNSEVKAALQMSPFSKGGVRLRRTGDLLSFSGNPP